MSGCGEYVGSLGSGLPGRPHVPQFDGAIKRRRRKEMRRIVGEPRDVDVTVVHKVVLLRDFSCFQVVADGPTEAL